MLHTCKYDPIKDICAVVQTGFIDVVECFMNGEVPATFGDDELPYNGIENPIEVGANVSDVFEAIRAAHAMEHAAQVAGVESTSAPVGAGTE